MPICGQFLADGDGGRVEDFEYVEIAMQNKSPKCVCVYVRLFMLLQSELSLVEFLAIIIYTCTVCG